MSKGKNKGKRRSPVVVATPTKANNGINKSKVTTLTRCVNCEDTLTTLKDCSFCKAGFCADNENCSKACSNAGCEKTLCSKCAVGCKDCDVSTCPDCADHLMVTGHCGETWCAFCGAKDSTDADCALCSSSEREIRQVRAGHVIAEAVTRSTFQRLCKERPLRSASENQDAAEAESKSTIQLMGLPGISKSDGDLDELEDIEDDTAVKKKKTKPSNSKADNTSSPSVPNASKAPVLSDTEMARRRADMSATELLEEEAREKREQEEAAEAKRQRKRGRKNKLKQQRKMDDDRVQDILASESAQAFSKPSSGTDDDENCPTEEDDDESDDDDDDNDAEEEEDKNESQDIKDKGSDKAIGKGIESSKKKKKEVSKVPTPAPSALAAKAGPMDAAARSAAGKMAGETAAREAAEGLRIEDWEDPESAYFKKLLGPYLWGNLFKDNNTSTMTELLVLECSPVDLPRWGVMLGRIQAQAARDEARGEEEEPANDDTSLSTSTSAAPNGDTSSASASSTSSSSTQANANSAEATAAAAAKVAAADKAKAAADKAKAEMKEARAEKARAEATEQRELQEQRAKVRVEAKMKADAEAKAKADADRRAKAKARAELAKKEKVEARARAAIREAEELKAAQEAQVAAAERRALKKQQKKQEKLEKKAAQEKAAAELQAQQRFLAGGAGGDAEMVEAFRVAEKTEKREAIIKARADEELANRLEQTTRAEGITMTNMGDVTVKTGAFHVDQTPEQLLQRAIDQSHAFDYDAYGALDGDLEEMVEEESRIINNLEKSLKRAHAANSNLRRTAKHRVKVHTEVRDRRADQLRKAAKKLSKKERKAATRAATAREAEAEAAAAAGAGASYADENQGAVTRNLQQVAERVWGQLGGGQLGGGGREANRQDENRELHARVRENQEQTRREAKAFSDETREREQIEMQHQRDLEMQMTPEEILNQPIVRDWENKECFFWFEKNSCRFGDKCHLSHARLDGASEGTASGASTPRYGTAARAQAQAVAAAAAAARARASPVAAVAASPVRLQTLAVLQRPGPQQQANVPITGAGAAAVGAGGLAINANGATAMPRLAVPPNATAKPYVPAPAAAATVKAPAVAGSGKHIPAALRAECVEVINSARIDNSQMNAMMRKLKKIVGEDKVNGATTLKGLLPKTAMHAMDTFLLKKKVDHTGRMVVLKSVLGTYE